MLPILPILISDPNISFIFDPVLSSDLFMDLFLFFLDLFILDSFFSTSEVSIETSDDMSSIVNFFFIGFLDFSSVSSSDSTSSNSSSESSSTSTVSLFCVLILDAFLDPFLEPFLAPPFILDFLDPFLEPFLDDFLVGLLLFIYPSTDTSVSISSNLFILFIFIGLALFDEMSSISSLSTDTSDDISFNLAELCFGESYDTSDRSDLDLKELKVEFPKINFFGLFKLFIISLINIFISLDILFNFNNDSKNILVSYVLSSFFKESIILSLSNLLIIIESSKLVNLISNPIFGIIYLFSSSK